MGSVQAREQTSSKPIKPPMSHIWTRRGVCPAQSLHTALARHVARDIVCWTGLEVEPYPPAGYVDVSCPSHLSCSLCQQIVAHANLSQCTLFLRDCRFCRLYSRSRVHLQSHFAGDCGILARKESLHPCLAARAPKARQRARITSLQSCCKPFCTTRRERPLSRAHIVLQDSQSIHLCPIPHPTSHSTKNQHGQETLFTTTYCSPNQPSANTT